MTQKNKGGRPKKSDKDKRPFQVNTYLNQKEFDALKEFENTYLFSTSETIRLALHSLGLETEFNNRNKPSSTDKNSLDIKKELTKIGINLNQISRNLNTYKNPNQINSEEINNNISAVISLIKEVKNDL